MTRSAATTSPARARSRPAAPRATRADGAATRPPPGRRRDPCSPSRPQASSPRESQRQHTLTAWCCQPKLTCVAVLIWLLAFRDNGNGTRSAVVVQKGTVPNVVGQPQATAVAAVKKAGLQPVVTKRVALQPAGIVVGQQPGPGKVLKAGAAVHLVVSRGPPPVAVPDVKGLAAADAVAKLQQAKLAPRLVEVKSKKTAGTLVAEDPPPGSKVKPGSRVTLN